jgi:RecB family exonuclease
VQVLVHPDPVLLEEELLARVADAQAVDPLAPVLVLVPTARLAGHVQRRLLDSNEALLGVEVLHYEGLVGRLLDESDDPPMRLASRRHQLALLLSVVESLPETEIAAFVRKRPGALSALLGTLRDLRKAGISPEEAAAQLGEGREEELSRIYHAYTRALEAWEERGWVDEAGRARRALPRAEAYAGRFRGVLHHGAYELIGVHLDLVRALGRGAPLAFLAPVAPGSPGTAYAEGFTRRHLLEEGEEPLPLDREVRGLLGGRLDSLFLVGSRPDPLPAPERVSFRHAQGEEAEAALAVRHALAAVSEGTSAEEIVLVARGLAPYGAALEETLDEELGDRALSGDPLWTSSLGTPLGREPAVRDLLRLLRAAVEDFPRAATAEVLSSPRLRWTSLLPGETRPPGYRADPWSRKAGILGGLEEWTEDLVAWAEGSDEPREEESAEQQRARLERRTRRVEGARGLGRGLEALAARLEIESERSWAGHADRLEALVREVLPGAGEERPPEAISSLLGLLEEMRLLDELLPSARALPFESAVEWLERAVSETELRRHSPDRGGIRVLDAMQARGLTHDRVMILGLHAGSFPRVPREDPLLRDETRRRLRAATGRPLPVKGEGESEERLLFSLLLGSARERLDLSWQRADTGGRTRSPSLALREVARLVHGSPELGLVLEGARGLPSHPEARLERLAAEPGLLSPREGVLLAALRSDAGEESSAELAGLDPRLAPGLRLLRATESFAPGGGEHDGRVGAGAVPERRWSVTALERLGRCPLQFFFRDVLRVYELRDEARADQIAPWDLGVRVHLLLERLYRELSDEGLLGPRSSTDACRERARGRLPELWEEILGDMEARLSRRLPLLWNLSLEAWRQGLDAFVQDDLRRMAGKRPVGFERTLVEEIDLGAKTRVSVEGRFDRILEGEEGPVVGDYKTSGKLAPRVDETRMLKALTLQVPLYQLLAGEGSTVELIGVGPLYLDETGEPLEPERFEGFATGERAASFRETLRKLLGLARRGEFPLVPDDHCRWCAWSGACRRNHPPTLHREGSTYPAKLVAALRMKNKTNPTVELPARGKGKRAGEKGS